MAKKTSLVYISQTGKQTILFLSRPIGRRVNPLKAPQKSPR
jgi:hypothetical protein